MLAHSNNVSREPPSQRRHYRLAVPLSVTLNGRTYVTHNWSMGGFSIHPFQAPALPIGQELHGFLKISFGDFQISFDFDAAVVRFSEPAEILGCSFINLNDKHTELLKYFSNSLIGGQMKAIDDIIKRIDIPVTPVSEKQDPRTATAAPLARRRLKVATMSGLYLTLGALAASYATMTVFDNIFTLRVDSAVVMGSEVAVKAPVSGTVDILYSSIGDRVEPGQALLYIRDEDTLERISLAALDVRDARTHLAEAKAKLAAQRNTLLSYKVIGADKLSIASSKVSALTQQMVIAKSRAERMAKLKDSGSISEMTYEESVDRYLDMQSSLQVAESELKIAQQSLQETDQGRFFTDSKLEGEVAELLSAVKTAEETVALEDAKLDVLRHRLDRHVVVAPTAGSVSRLHADANAVVGKGDPLLLIDRGGDRYVDAYLPAQDLNKVPLGTRAAVIVSTRNAALSAQVIDVDTLGNLARRDDPNLAPGAHPNQMLTARVRLRLLETDATTREALANLRTGVPVQVEFEKPNSLVIRSFAAVAAWFSRDGNAAIETP